MRIHLSQIEAFIYQLVSIYSFNSILIKYNEYIEKGKAVPVTGLGSYETSRLPHFLDNRFTDEGEVSVTRRPPLTRRNIAATHFYLRLS
jgi:hypothetical protein